jgi:hypothetical protein
VVEDSVEEALVMAVALVEEALAMAVALVDADLDSVAVDTFH